MQKVFKRMFLIKTPISFVLNLANIVISDYKLSGMKSHGYHVFLQFMIPIAIRGTLSRKIKEGIYMLATFLRWFCGEKHRYRGDPILEGKNRRDYMFV